MSVMDFPSSPTEGQIYAPPGGPRYQWNSPVWDVVGTSGAGSSDDLWWETRAAFVASVAGGMPVYVGKTYTAGGLQYVGKAGATAIPDLSGLLPSGDVTPQHFGATGADDTMAVQAAVTYLASLGGGVLWFVQPGSHTLSSINLASNVVVDVGPGVTLQHKSDATSAMFLAVGAKSGAPLSLAADVQAGVTSFALTAVGTIAAGSWIILKDAADFSVDAAAVGYKSGESLVVKSVTGATLNFDRKISGSFQADRAYTIARGGNVELVSAPLHDICVRGEGKLIGHKNFNIGLIEMRYVDGARVEGVHVETFGGVGVFFRNCRNIRAAPRYVADGRNDTAGGFPGYGIALDEACDVALVADVFVTKTRHAFTTMGGANGGPSRVTVDNLTVTENDFTGIDTHSGVHDIVVSNNKVFGGNAAGPGGTVAGGILMRANEARVTGNTIVDCPGTGIGTVGEGMFKIVIDNNTVMDCGTQGISVSSTVASLEIVDNTVLRCGNNGIAVLGGSYDTGISRILIKGNTVRDFGRTATSRSGIEVSTATASIAGIEDNTVAAVNGQEGRGIYTAGSPLLTGKVHRNAVRGAYSILSYSLIAATRGEHNVDDSKPFSVFVSIADDAVYDLVGGVGTLAVLYGISMGSTGANLPNGFFRARTDATPQCSAITTFGANVTLTTGVSTSVAAADGNFTISAMDGHLYFINRIGGTASVLIQQLTDFLRT